ncbi:MAG: hypothetical protein AAF502_19420 [Bacteroidota bacterium]
MTSHKSYIATLLSFGLLIFLSSCESEQNELEAYYFPFEELKEGLVYEYRSVNNDSLVPEYWYYRTFDGENGERFLAAQAYDHLFNVTQFSREEFVGNGSLMFDYRLYEYDSTGTAQIIEPLIEDANVFPFTISEDSGFLRFKMKWQEILEPEMTVTLSRGRQFQKFTTHQMLDVNLPAAEFATTELVEFDHTEEGHREYEGTSKEIYAKDFGLVYYRKVVDEQFVFEYELAGRYTMEEFERFFSERLFPLE